MYPSPIVMPSLLLELLNWKWLDRQWSMSIRVEGSNYWHLVLDRSCWYSDIWGFWTWRGHAPDFYQWRGHIHWWFCIVRNSRLVGFILAIIRVFGLKLSVRAVGGTPSSSSFWNASNRISATISYPSCLFILACLHVAILGVRLSTSILTSAVHVLLPLHVKFATLWRSSIYLLSIFWCLRSCLLGRWTPNISWYFILGGDKE